MGKAVRQAHVYASVDPISTMYNSLRVYIKEACRVDKSIPPILRPLDRKMQNIDDYGMIDVNAFMTDMSGMLRHRFILRLREGLSGSYVHVHLVGGRGGAGKASTHTLFGGSLPNQIRMNETRA